MSSDHLPITISIKAELHRVNAKNQTFINFSKANWPAFNSFVKNKFSRARPINSIHKAVIFFRHTLQRAAKKFIPAGRIPKTFNALPTDAAELIDERDEIRNTNPADPRIPDLNKNIQQKIRDHKKQKWIEHLSKCQAGSKKLWSTIKSLNNQPIQPDNQGISFNDKITTNNKNMANNFNTQYTPDTDKKPDKTLRQTLRHLKKKSKDPPVVFTPAQTLAAIRKSKL